MIWRIFILFALLTVAATSLIARRQRPDQLPKLNTPLPPQPGYFMTDATVLQTAATGLPLYRMTAARIQQDPKDLSIKLDDLRLIYTATGRDGDDEDADADGNAWTLTANTGFVKSLDARIIDLQGDVRISGTPEVGTGRSRVAPAVIRTSRLQVDAVASTASTRERVDIQWSDRHFSAIGLNADLKNQRLKLESAVHGQFTR